MYKGRLRSNTLTELVEIIRPLLIKVAKERKVITYKELMETSSGRPGRGYIGEVKP